MKRSINGLILSIPAVALMVSVAFAQGGLGAHSTSTVGLEAEVPVSDGGVLHDVSERLKVFPDGVPLLAPLLEREVWQLGDVCIFLRNQAMTAEAMDRPGVFLNQVSEQCAWLSARVDTDRVSGVEDPLIAYTQEKFLVFGDVLRDVLEAALSTDDPFPVLSDSGVYLMSQQLEMGVVLRWVAQQQTIDVTSFDVLITPNER